MEYFERNLSSWKPSHVYISFRHDDEEDEGSRRFIRSLSAALKAQGFTIFGHHPNLQYYQLGAAIDKSWVWIVVFSKNYTCSSWCLCELAKFAGCEDFTFYRAKGLMYRGEKMGETEIRMEAEIEKLNKWMGALKNGPYDHECGSWSVGDRIIPIYYDVDPHDILHHAYTQYPFERRQRKLYAVQQVLSLPAWHLPKYSPGSQVIPKIVKQVKTKIDKHFYDFFRFVGIQYQVEELEKLLYLSAHDEVRLVGICGMGGLGKSSIAKLLYLKIFHYFDAFCFLPNVSARLKQGDISMQQLLRRHLQTESAEARHFIDKEFLICKKLRNHKFLIVLDGVDLVQHLQELNLVEKSNCFGMGSRIIITTRDEHVLQEYEVDAVYWPKLLSKDEAFNLFCNEAFPKEYPTEDFKEMIDRVLEYANGLPLALEKLGSSLFGKGIAQWRIFLNREEIIPPLEIIMVLKKSYDELEDISKEMFLDTACFFVWKDINWVKEILHDCFNCDVDIIMKLFIQKSIITIANMKIQMHSMLQAMGREIVREQCPNQPDKLSRLYRFRDIKYAMEKERCTEIENVEAIALELEEPNITPLSIDALSDMINLRLLIFYNVKVFGSLDNLPSELRYVSWHQYPFTALPSRFQSDTLVQLIMPESNMTEVWEGNMMLPELRKIDLSGSKTLMKTPDFGGVPKLERLELEGCTGLLRLDPSISKLSKLKFLNLRGCINLVSIPNSLLSHNSLEVLNLASCSKLAYCLEFSPMKSMIQVNLLSIWDSPPLEKLLYFLLLVLPEQKSYHDFACCCLIYLMCICEVTFA